MTNLLEKIKENLNIGFKREIDLFEKRPGIFQLVAPFYYPDGDMIEIFLVEKGGKVLIQDYGMTVMKLSYEFNIDTEHKQRIFNEILTQNKVEEENGNLFLYAPFEGMFPYVMQFIQTIIKVSDLDYLKKENVKNLFYENFEKFMDTRFKNVPMKKDYSPDFDVDKIYVSPYAVFSKKEGVPPMCIYPTASNSKCDEVIVKVLTYERHNVDIYSVVVFDKQEDIARKQLARLSDAVGKQFSSLSGNTDRIVGHIEKYYQKGLAV